MAAITLSDDQQYIDVPEQVAEYLEPLGIWYEHWPVEGRLAAEATGEEILAEYSPEIERLKKRGGYVTADVVNVSPETPGLDEMCAKFDKEHTHSEDEVRFTVEGRGVFWIHLKGAPVFSIEVESGDMIKVPAGVRHWFHLCEDRHIRCIRLFQNAGGWTPEYIEQGIHGEHAPMCWGKTYLPGETMSAKTKVKPVVEL